MKLVSIWFMPSAAELRDLSQSYNKSRAESKIKKEKCGTPILALALRVPRCRKTYVKLQQTSEKYEACFCIFHSECSFWNIV